MDNKNFGRQLKILRKTKGYTQQALAEKAGIDEKHLSRIENGRFFPTYSTLTKLLLALDTNIEEVGLDLKNITPDKGPVYSKILQIINSARNEKELFCFLEGVKVIQKTIQLKNN